VGRRSEAPSDDFRMAKVRQKVSGSFRTCAGAKAYCALRSHLHTAQKHALRGLDMLVQLFKGCPLDPRPSHFAAIKPGRPPEQILSHQVACHLAKET
jgi:hypothetical protein